MKRLDGLGPKPAWMTHMRCHPGSVEYLGLRATRAWGSSVRRVARTCSGYR